MMPEQLEKRVALLEAEVARLKQKIEDVPSQLLSSSDDNDSSRNLTLTPWWEKIVGTFANNSAYDEAMELGREYRQSEQSSSFELSDD